MTEPRMAASIRMFMPGASRMINALGQVAPKEVARGLEAAMYAAVIDISARVKNLIDGPVLHRRSTRLWRSITSDVYRRGGTMVGVVGTNVEYAAIHEFGGTIRSKKEGGFLFFHIDGSPKMVREVKMPKRPYMSRAFHEREKAVAKMTEDYVMRAINGTLQQAKILPVAERVGVGFNATIN